MLVRLILGLLLFGGFAPARARAQARPTVEIFLLKPMVPAVPHTGFFQPTTAQLADTALLTDTDLRGYVISGQDQQRRYVFHLSSAGQQKLGQLWSRHIAMYGQPFAVVVNGQPLFGGYFWSALSSFSSEWLTVMLGRSSGSMSLVNGAGMLKAHFTPERPDPRAAPQLLDALRQTGRLTHQ